MTKKIAAPATKTSIIQSHLNGRPELKKKYGSNALPLLGLALHIQADDIDAFAAEALTDGGNDKKDCRVHTGRSCEDSRTLSFRSVFR